jgi:hypothetical protein
MLASGADADSALMVRAGAVEAHGRRLVDDPDRVGRP